MHQTFVPDRVILHRHILIATYDEMVHLFFFLLCLFLSLWIRSSTEPGLRQIPSLNEAFPLPDMNQVAQLTGDRLNHLKIKFESLWGASTTVLLLIPKTWKLQIYLKAHDQVHRSLHHVQCLKVLFCCRFYVLQMFQSLLTQSFYFFSLSLSPKPLW